MPYTPPEWFKKLYKDEKLDLLREFDAADEEKFCAAFMAEDDRHIRRRAVAKLEDQERLWHYAVSDPAPLVREEAISRLSGDDRLLGIVNSEPEIRGRQAAVSRIRDQRILFELASSHPDRWVRKAAIQCLSSDDDLMQIVFSDSEENELRLNAALKITGQEHLKKLIAGAEELSGMDGHNAIRDSADVRRVAVLKLDDHEMLRQVAADYGERRIVRIAAVSKLGADDQDLLEWVKENTSKDN